MTHRGEMGPGIFDVIEMITRFFKGKVAAMGELSWQTPREAAAAFRNRFKNRLATAMARGWARQMLAAGDTAARPVYRHRKRRSHSTGNLNLLACLF